MAAASAADFDAFRDVRRSTPRLIQLCSLFFGEDNEIENLEKLFIFNGLAISSLFFSEKTGLFAVVVVRRRNKNGARRRRLSNHQNRLKSSRPRLDLQPPGMQQRLGVAARLRQPLEHQVASGLVRR